MCKFDQIIHVDNEHRGFASTGSSDFEIDLDHPLILDDSNGVAIRSLTIENPLQTLLTGVNDMLYTELDGTQQIVKLGTRKTYDGTTM